MKRKLLVLGMVLICIFGMTACGENTNETTSNTYGITEEDAINYADQVIDSVRSIVDQNMQDQYAGDAVVSAALSSWTGALEDIGEVNSIGNHEVSIGDNGVTINVKVDGSSHDALIEILLDEDLSLTSITTNVEYTFGELMTNAALNTVLGMGTVFVVLILICLIIYCFAFIPKIQAAFSGKKKEETAAPAVSAAPVQAAVEEELTDDYELVAVIAAAVAACEGAASTDGFVVRSIRRAGNRKW